MVVASPVDHASSKPADAVRAAPTTVPKQAARAAAKEELARAVRDIFHVYVVVFAAAKKAGARLLKKNAVTSRRIAVRMAVLR